MDGLDDLGDLYGEMILDHQRRPRNFRDLPDANRRAVGHNPLCGDRIAITVRLEADSIREIGFTGDGCAISKASASIMTDAVKSRTRAEVEALYGKFHSLVTGPSTGAPGDGAALGKLAVFGGVSRFPMRVKCATLAWHTLRAALEGRGATVTTEKESS